MRCQFRMVRKSGKPFIFIREIKDGKAAREFSSKVFRHDSEEDIAACAEKCIAAHKGKGWGSTEKSTPGRRGLSWELVAQSALLHLQARVVRLGSRRNAEGHLREIAKLTGPVTPRTLEKWALERDPVKPPSAFRNRLETISHINKAGDLRLDEALTCLLYTSPSPRD